MAIVAVVLNSKLYIANVGELVFVSGSVSAFLKMAGVPRSKIDLNVGDSVSGLWPSSDMLATCTALEISLAVHPCRCWLMWCVWPKSRGKMG